MPVFGDRPYTSITIKINQLASPVHNEDGLERTIELHLSDLLHLIQIQPSTGATEAARAIRKRIKYGDTVEEQLRALSILELLVLNSGTTIGSTIASDDKLLDVLKGILSGHGHPANGTSYDGKVRTKVKNLAIGWKTELAEIAGFKYLAGLWKYIPGTKQRSHSRASSRGDNVFESSLDNSPPALSPSTPKSNKKSPPPPRPKTLSPFSVPKKDKKSKKKGKRKRRYGVKYADEEYRIPQINYKVEAPKIRTVIADCHTHTTSLNNILLTLPPARSPVDEPKAVAEFDKCRKIRHRVLRYLQLVGAGNELGKSGEVRAMDEEFLGSLIFANEQLVTVFKKYDAACGYTAENPAPTYDDESSDSDGYESYYSDETSEAENEVYDDEDNSISNRLGSLDVGEGSSSHKGPEQLAPALPVGEQDETAKSTTLHNKHILKVETNTSISSDPFGDNHQV